ncbi:VIR protein [Plasmodium vivax]|uniref:VIR protein n=1 Tax=Plasmodium vivax TaxID=5855 RepID=A0A1G4E9F4_PLAVI|nr:VIR protein [Plasmodium vivax]
MMESSDVHNELKRFNLSFREELYSEIFNETFYKLENLNDNVEYCSSLDKFPSGTSIKKICLRLLKYLENNSFSRNNDNEYIYCLLLNYWVFSSLNILLYSKHSSKIVPAFAEIVLTWYNFIDYKLKERENITCKPISNIPAYDDWKKRKELYEYYLDYYPVSLTVKNYPVRCNEFYKYVESKKNLYEHFKKRCPPNDTERCPEFYAQCLQYEPDKVLQHLSCHTNIMQERASDTSRVPQIGNGHSVSEPNSDNSDGRKMPDDAPILSGNPHTVTKLGNVLLGVVATSMTSGALYRFTPLGGMIRNGLGWNTNNMRNFNGEDIRLYDYASDPFNPYPAEEHYIGYHPA